jgi:uncharacterized OsmC-like protein
MIELVWDEIRRGTATSASGHTIAVGEQADFSPDDLLALATAACLMRTFLRLADEERAPLLSYAATARAAPACASNVRPHVTIHAYLLASSAADRASLTDRFARSVRLSPIARVLGDDITVTSEVRVLHTASGHD